MSGPVTPRTRADKLPREHWTLDHAHVGKATMPETCPRCGWPCTHLVRAYWDSPWNAHGGLCSQCIREAVVLYDRNGWPPDPMEPEVVPEPERPAAAPAPKLFGA